MARSGDLRSLTDLLGATLARLGVEDLPTMLGLIEDWPELAGEPWASHAVPLVLRNQTLVVEASSPTAVRLLRYGERDLLGALQARFGAHSITKVEVTAPSR